MKNPDPDSSDEPAILQPGEIVLSRVAAPTPPDADILALPTDMGPALIPTGLTEADFTRLMAAMNLYKETIVASGVPVTGSIRPPDVPRETRPAAERTSRTVGQETDRLEAAAKRKKGRLPPGAKPPKTEPMTFAGKPASEVDKVEIDGCLIDVSGAKSLGREGSP